MTIAVLPLLTPAEFQHRAETVVMEPLAWSVMARKGLHLWVRRDDAVDECLSGNKFYKLFFNLMEARAQGKRLLASFGGAYSNHLYALAAAGKRYGFATLGIVRGERPARLSPTLKDVESWGMRLHFLTRNRYRQGADEALLAELCDIYGDFYLVPEGGANICGARGMQVLGQALESSLAGNYDQVCLACGTGTSLAGVAAGLPVDKLALGFSVLKGEGRLGASINAYWQALQEQHKEPRAANWRVISGYHAGGYGHKLPDTLQVFWREFEQETGLLLDPVYTLKLFWGIAQLAEQNYWRRGTRLVAVHTGGLQGRRGFLNENTP